MDAVLAAGVKLILFLQGMGGWMTAPMQGFTFLGSEEFYLIVAPVFLWCIDYQLGLRVGLFCMFSSSANLFFKMAFHGPRPYWIDARVQAMSSEYSFGIPSNHSQSAVIVWGSLARWAKRAWFWVVAVAVMFLIGLSRLYLGVHFPSDVIAGWLIGIALLILFILLESPIKRWLAGRANWQKLAAAFALSMALVLLCVLARMSLSAWVVPESWYQLAAAALKGDSNINGFTLADIMKQSGAFFGLAAGAILFGSFSAEGPVEKRLLRFAVGLIGVLILWRGLGLVFPRNEDIISYLLYYLRYTLIGVWLTGGAPYLFGKFGLLQKAETAEALTPVKALNK